MFHQFQIYYKLNYNLIYFLNIADDTTITFPPAPGLLGVGGELFAPGTVAAPVIDDILLPGGVVNDPLLPGGIMNDPLLPGGGVINDPLNPALGVVDPLLGGLTPIAAGPGVDPLAPAPFPADFVTPVPLLASECPAPSVICGSNTGLAGACVESEQLCVALGASTSAAAASTTRTVKAAVSVVLSAVLILGYL